MKTTKMLFLFLISSTIFFGGCSSGFYIGPFLKDAKLSDYAKTSIRTNITRSDGVTVTCPVTSMKIGKKEVKIGKIVLWKYSRHTLGEQFEVLPGRPEYIPADGFFADQNMILVGFVYDTKGNLIGRVENDNLTFGNNSDQPKIYMWNITKWESVRSERDTWWWPY